MDITILIYLVLLVLAAVLTYFLARTLMNLAETLKSLNALIASLNRDLPPVINGIEVTVKQVNEDLEKLNGVVSNIEDVSEKVNGITTIVQDIVASPLIKVAAFSSGAKKALAAFMKKGG